MLAEYKAMKAIEAWGRISEKAALDGLTDMTMDEINAEIAKAHNEAADEPYVAYGLEAIAV